MSDHVPFDRDWFDIGYIEPEFHEELRGWANEQTLIDSGFVALRVASSRIPVRWVPSDFAREPLPEPIPLIKTVLKWRWTGNIPKEART